MSGAELKKLYINNPDSEIFSDSDRFWELVFYQLTECDDEDDVLIFSHYLNLFDRYNLDKDTQCDFFKKVVARKEKGHSISFYMKKIEDIDLFTYNRFYHVLLALTDILENRNSSKP